MARRATLLSTVLAAIGVGAGVAVPIVELHLLRRGQRPQLPAHPLDGAVGVGPVRRRIVWLGDSLAAGVGASSPAGSLPHQVAQHLGGRFDVCVLARPGARVADVVADQLPLLQPRCADADLVVLSVGANDVSGMTRRSDFLRDYNTILASVGTTPVAALSVPDMGAALVMAQPLRWIAGVRARMVDRWIRRCVADHTHARRIDIATRAAHARPVRRYLAADLYHPNDHGYREWASAIASAITEWAPAFSTPAAWTAEQ